MSWFLVGVLLHSLFYLQVVECDENLYCPSVVYYADQLPVVDSCIDDLECQDGNKKCCTTIVIDKNYGVELGTYSKCATPEIKSINGYCPTIIALDSTACYGTVCIADEGCSGLDICCSNACNTRTCMAPTIFLVTKNGQCPDTLGEIGEGLYGCTNDFNCSGEQKCCGASDGKKYCFNPA